MIEGSFNSQSISQLRHTALNRDHPGPGQVLFNRIDQNDSGGLDFDEILALVDKTDRGSKLLEKFSEIDQDETGELSLQEIKSYFKG
jgi:hypothetical protein